ncbi:MHYT domain-containing protein [Streptomyces sp. ALI-76-A]|jgi:NO-binding membrane sensor protein with MHYT domain|uniref:MHYT domain-containing protein n=1 Tax=Streptomyces sp. ALI-76-A TaxID=3025736 RepID=UPI00256F1D8C|nr:MHYT domain-containing protein [Streptomyces sp. ALI-76-A]MDL5199361.1 MHYT domain-containing protein [Streptomyces sp. ALI-76-A]
MEGTVDGFRYGAVTPVAAYLMACLGGALGLRCIVRTLLGSPSHKPGWLALGAASIGSGIWTMHFIAMIGFKVEETRVRYDAGLTVLSLAVAIVVVGIGVFIVGYRGADRTTLGTAGVITGLGVAAMHYLGMAAMHINGDFRYDPLVVALSVAIAVVAATAALWAAVSVRGFLTSLGASLIMGVAVSGMHYTGMAAVSVHVHDSGNGTWAGDSPTSLLLPMLLGPVIFLVLAGVVVMFDPLLVLGDGDWSRGTRSSGGGVPDAPAGPPPAAQHRSLFDAVTGSVRRDVPGGSAPGHRPPRGPHPDAPRTRGR